jgi:hypothetical protein
MLASKGNSQLNIAIEKSNEMDWQRNIKDSAA